MQSRTHPNHGFTLLEILMAISIFAIVISLAYGAYRSTFRIIDHTESQTEIYNQARIAMHRISNDLGSLYLGSKGSLQGKAQTLGNKQADTIQFTSTAHLILNREEQAAGLATISYTVVEDPDTRELSLLRHDQAFRPSENEEPVLGKGLLLCEGLQEVRLVYYDTKGEQKDSWDSKEIEKADTNAQALPGRIEVSLLFADPVAGSKPIRFSTGVTFPTGKPAASSEKSQ
jgi:general secretion pathway protein J